MPFRPWPVDQSDVGYLHGPDSLRLPGIPVGRTIEFDWADSAVYPGTARKFWVHLPARYDPSRPAALLVFQDGWWNLDPAGEVRGGIVLDNLIHNGDIPPTIGVFVDPGALLNDVSGQYVGDAAVDGAGTGGGGRRQRNVEYDAFDDRYATFLLTEIIPQVTERFSITDDPEQWGICGGSSGGNCAFTVAWLRPDRFRRVLCFLSSFVQMPGGNPYPQLIKDTPRKPLRIFLQAGHRDLNWNGPEDNWFASNLRVAAALAEAGYDFRLVLGDGGHSPNHSGVLLPDALRWLWRVDP
ncbi:enterochelin esterase family protein [Micromonospora sp. Llam0]|nr:enterochelin esterase family protein [Micromonospora sp. Llam0]